MRAVWHHAVKTQRSRQPFTSSCEPSMKASRAEIDKLLLGKLSEALTKLQKSNKINNLITKMTQVRPNRQSRWRQGFTLGVCREKCKEKMKLKFKIWAYQIVAVQAMVDCFKGQLPANVAAMKYTTDADRSGTPVQMTLDAYTDGNTFKKCS